MPYRVLIIASRKPDISPGRFKTHYENSHVPLLKSLTGPLFPQSHTRRYVHRVAGDNNSPPGTAGRPARYPATVLIGQQSDVDYDAIAELVFDNQAAFEAFFAKVREPDVAVRIGRDEEMFLDRTRMKVVVLGDCLVTNGPPRLTSNGSGGYRGRML